MLRRQGHKKQEPEEEFNEATAPDEVETEGEDQSVGEKEEEETV